MSTAQQRIGEKHVINCTTGHEGSPVREARHRRSAVWCGFRRAARYLAFFAFSSIGSSCSVETLV